MNTEHLKNQDFINKPNQLTHKNGLFNSVDSLKEQSSDHGDIKIPEEQKNHSLKTIAEQQDISKSNFNVIVLNNLKNSPPDSIITPIPQNTLVSEEILHTKSNAIAYTKNNDLNKLKKNDF